MSEIAIGGLRRHSPSRSVTVLRLRDCAGRAMEASWATVAIVRLVCLLRRPVWCSDRRIYTGGASVSSGTDRAGEVC